ncbi:MAG: glutathione S-transferase [Mariprofundaceae bacterium]
MVASDEQQITPHNSISDTALPILYSFRRCPYAMRARMALLYAGIRCQLREVELRDKPAAMLSISAKGTVPVLQLADGQVLAESLDIMLWALNRDDVRHPLIPQAGDMRDILRLIDVNDRDFKYHLDRYKYPDRYKSDEHDCNPYQHRAQAGEFIAALEVRLADALFLFADTATLADIAIFPFVRQFAATDRLWFEQAPYPHVRNWLQHWLDEALFQRAMVKHPAWKTNDKTVYFA